MSPDNDLLSRMRRGDHSAFESLYDRHSPAMYAIALRILGKEDEACTALEATFLALWEGRLTYSPSFGNAGAWLLRIARDQALAMRPATIPIQRRPATPTPRQLVEDVFLGGGRVEDIAQTYELPEAKVRDLLRCGMAELRSEFEARR
jgi:DNA-directed RNA polymerase specialized sigma24 family protein